VPGVLTNFGVKVVSRFTDVVPWILFAGPGHWNDLDSLEIGNGDHDGLTPDERVTTMTFWAIESAPLILRSLDQQDLRLLTNDEVIRVDRAGVPSHPLSQATPGQVWFSRQRDGSLVVGLFNLDTTARTV
jgi:alpha-galactosidase